MKKHICNKEKTVEVDGYIAIRDNQVVIVKPYKPVSYTHLTLPTT